MSIGERLLLARRRRGLAAWRIAALAQIDPTTYSRIERDERVPSLDQRLAIARALEIEPEQLFEKVHA
jgi:transcriptional regulator with XRE-family HTH domain